MSDLQKRWKADTLDLKPEILSILIGVNDLDAGVAAETYEKQYDFPPLAASRVQRCEIAG